MEPGVQSMISDISAGAGEAASFINRIWVDWKIGPVMAVLSMVMVFTRDYGLIKDFVKSESKLKKWPKLASYTAARVCMSVAAYHGPVWVVEWIIWFFQVLWGGLVRLYKFLSGVDQAFVMHGTTAVILIAFIGVTVWAVKSWAVRKLEAFRDRRGGKKQEPLDVPPEPVTDVDTAGQEVSDGSDAQAVQEQEVLQDWDSDLVSRKQAWRNMSLNDRMRILARDGRDALGRLRDRVSGSRSEFPDVDIWRKAKQDLQSLPEDDAGGCPFDAADPGPGLRIPAKSGRKRR